MDLRLNYKTRNYKTTKRKQSTDFLNRTPNTTNESKNKPKGLHQTNQQTKKLLPGTQRLTPVILATQESGTKKTEVHSQPRQIVCETYLESLNTRKGWQT
jgi:hypothetical protein